MIGSTLDRTISVFSIQNNKEYGKKRRDPVKVYRFGHIRLSSWLFGDG